MINDVDVVQGDADLEKNMKQYCRLHNHIYNYKYTLAYS